MTPPSTPGTPRWYAATQRVQAEVIRRTIGPRLRARDADVPLGGAANRVRHPKIGHVAFERLVVGENPPPRELEQHIARYAWAFRFVEGKSVVDVGSGGGYGSFLLNWISPDVVGVDLDPGAVEAARAAFTGPRYEVVDGTSGNLPKADVATCFEVIEHVTDPARLCHELLTAAPEVLLSYPNALLGGPHLNPHHLVDWPLRQLKRALVEAGATEMQFWHQRMGSATVHKYAPPWAASWLVRACR
jgi:2-polyprenyl-3-methyl-5-hydroxy-6-metoxy-1,4-benzoquinol methylase